MTNDSYIIQFKGVGIQFGHQVIHQDVSFSIKDGESVTLLGPSGIGKTLILKMIMGLLTPSWGEVIVMGQNMGRLSEIERTKLRRHIGMLFQGAALFDSLNVYENIAYSLREAKNYTEPQIKDIVNEKLGIVGLAGIGSKFPTQLSGGQKKRVGLARALASSPSIMLFDEPTTGLDPTATRLIDDLIVKLNQDYGMTAVSITHDIESAKRISNRWLLINKGMVVADGAVDVVSNSDNNVRDFINGQWKSEITLI